MPKFYESDDEPRFSKLMIITCAIAVFWWLGFFLNITEQNKYQFIVNTFGSTCFTLIAYGIAKKNGTPLLLLLLFTVRWCIKNVRLILH